MAVITRGEEEEDSGEYRMGGKTRREEEDSFDYRMGGRWRLEERRKMAAITGGEEDGD